MTEVLLRLGIAFAAGAFARMLQVFGVPWPITISLLLGAGAVVSYRQDAWRVMVVLTVSFGHLIAYFWTRTAVVAVAESVDPVPDTSVVFSMAGNAVGLFIPFALPALGSILALKMEQREAKRNADQEELTVESLLEEKIPQVQPEMTYDLSVLEHSSDDEPSAEPRSATAPRT